MNRKLIEAPDEVKSPQLLYYWRNRDIVLANRKKKRQEQKEQKEKELYLELKRKYGSQ